jgi:alpha-L-fucosidase
VADAHWRELIDRYEPDVLWNDISYPEVGDFEGIVADYYNRFPEGVINNRFGRLTQVADFTTPEYATYGKITAKKWESTRGVGYSFGYNRAETPEHLLSADELIDTFVDIVSKNGNLLIAVGPRGDGSIPELQVERLKELGRWLQVNGEAIYGSRYWVKAEGSAGDETRVRFTQKEDNLYIFLLDHPKDLNLTLRDLWFESGAEVQLLSTKASLTWRQVSKDVAIDLPTDLSPSPALVLKVTPKPAGLIKELEIVTEPQSLMP